MTSSRTHGLGSPTPPPSSLTKRRRTPTLDGLDQVNVHPFWEDGVLTFCDRGHETWLRRATTSNNWQSTPFAPCRWTPSRRPTAAIRARPWPWRRWPTCSATTCCVTTRPQPPGPPRSVRALLRPCLDAALLDAAPGRREAMGDRRAGRPTSRPCRWTTSGTSASSTAAARAIPSIGHTSGVETTTGPLGQGVANSVGMAIASRWLAASYNRPGLRAVRLQRLRPVQRRRPDGRRQRRGGLDRRPSEARRTSAGSTTTTRSRSKARPSLAFSEDVAARFAGYGWNVVKVADANDLAALRAAIGKFRQTDRPAHADHRPQRHRLRRAEQGQHARRPRRAAGRRRDPPDQGGLRLARRRSSSCPTKCRAFPPGHRRRGRQACARRGTAMFAEYRQQYPELAAQLELIERGELPAGLGRRHQAVSRRRQGRGQPGLVGQGAQPGGQERPLAAGRLGRPGPVEQVEPRPSTAPATFGPGSYARPQLPLRHPRTRHGGRSATAWPCAACGPTAATFFVFTDYMRPSMRLAAIMGLPVIYIFTHDSIGVGEDGPTHQPVEHLAALRAIPEPGRAAAGRRQRGGRGLSRDPATEATGRPSLVLTRQNLPTLDRTKYAPAAGVHQRRLRAGRRAGRQARGDPDRHRQRSVALRRRPTRNSRPKASRPGW